jgi:predicted O-methyltransferase YrrM
LFEAEGFSLRSSISPFMLQALDANPDRDGTLTHLMRADRDWRVASGAASLSEIYLFEALARVMKPARIFVHGIGAGWTPVAFALAFPDAHIRTIGGAAAALALIGQLAAKHRLALSTGKPDGVAELIFIDSAPADIAQEAAFAAARPFCGPDTLVMFQGVAVRRTQASFDAVAASLPGHRASILTRTSSGVGALVPEAAPAAVVRAISALIDPVFRA